MVVMVSIVVAKVVEVTEVVTIAVVVVTAVAVAVMVVLGILLVPSRQRHAAETRELQVSSRSILLTTVQEGGRTGREYNCPFEEDSPDNSVKVSLFNRTRNLYTSWGGWGNCHRHRSSTIHQPTAHLRKHTHLCSPQSQYYH